MSATIGEYILHRKLGEGASAEVWEASPLNGNGRYALKCIRLTGTPEKNEKSLNLLQNEYKALIELEHSGIIGICELGKSSIMREMGAEVPAVYLVMELANGGELFDYVALTGSFSETLARNYFKSLISTLEFIHSKSYAHRDIKLENLLLTSDYQLKVADFGLSCLLTEVNSTKYVGTTDYMAPEINARMSYCGVKADLFALGVLLFTMVAGHKPFRKASVQDKWYRMLCFDKEKFWNSVEYRKPAGTFSGELKDLITRLLSHRVEMRPSIKEIRGHLWYKGPDMGPKQVQEEMSRRQAKLKH